MLATSKKDHFEKLKKDWACDELGSLHIDHKGMAFWSVSTGHLDELLNAMCMTVVVLIGM